MLDKLIAAHFQVDFRSHAKAILEIDFPEVAEVIENVLLGSTIPIEEIIRSGGGETKGTQRLRNALRAREWNKHNFIVELAAPPVATSDQCRDLAERSSAQRAINFLGVFTAAISFPTERPTNRSMHSMQTHHLCSRSGPLARRSADLHRKFR